MAKRGRPTRYTPEVADEILELLAAGKTLTKICQADHLPAESTVRLWAQEDREGFSARYAQARELGYLRMADEVVDISDDSGLDVDVDDEGRVIIRGDVVQRARLRVDTRKWLLAKALPKIYGDRVAHEVSGPNGGPIEHRSLTDAELAERARVHANRIAALSAPLNGNGNGKHP